ncbi:MAG: helix-turn-helix transcriptional regulator [Magnetococcales bacterium]|nr:helix-turn-helix transcriptional regulator [Magnetococcales bacterium]
MNERVKAFRQRQKDKGLSQASFWLDDETVTLLKHVSETQQLQPGQVVSIALQQCFGNVTETGSLDGHGKRFCNVSETELLQGIIREVIREELACLRNGNATETVQETFQEEQDGPLVEDRGIALANGESAVIGFGGRLKAARERAGMSQGKLSKESGVAQSLISGLEAGKRQPSEEVQRKLATVLPELTRVQ